MQKHAALFNRPSRIPHPSHATASLGMRLHSLSKQLVAALLPLSTHKRHRVRIAALHALGPLMHQVCGRVGGWGGG